MNCNKVDHLIMKYMDGTLTKGEAKDLNSHIVGCSSCKEEFFIYQRVIEGMENDKAIEAPVDFEVGVMEKIKNIEIDYRPKKTTSLETIKAMVWGIFSLMFGIGVLLFIYRESFLEYMLQNPYIGHWAKVIVPTAYVLSSYIDQIKNEIGDILIYSKPLISSLRVVVISILTVLLGIQYYIYRRKKVEL
ncbi:MAG: zf-HC2 domain-containing protein [Epulopiscium sp.]|nr:zf-HC2 domain-containing protein [Candidatus Epulonipiscium sp.]